VATIPKRPPSRGEVIVYEKMHCAAFDADLRGLRAKAAPENSKDCAVQHSKERIWKNG
jgi:hypothetical protein